MTQETTLNPSKENPIKNVYLNKKSPVFPSDANLLFEWTKDVPMRKLVRVQRLSVWTDPHEPGHGHFKPNSKLPFVAPTLCWDSTGGGSLFFLIDLV